MSSPPVRRLTVSAMHHSRYAMQSLKDWVGRSPIALLGPRSSGRSGVHRALRFMSTAPDDFSIFQLAKDGKSKQIAEVLQRHKIDLSLKDVKGFTLLHYAAMNGHGDFHSARCQNYSSNQGRIRTSKTLLDGLRFTTACLLASPPA
ncbi:hypothetical protein GUITHDRAFT_118701 [Guillardia theta CCMP2712]|uniref:Uncharacterized protein n=1 Tax=Guillardia theta (strain CCMP2712) TaxID=905079 RepID=L1IFY0_GUITC|nr:hypothetical protein GUITHDRAFT_118701 [Guillardia theta CCMP2712]EKX35153.1 hypothetical protein GUITHDRAFT_118701 [Guillardia theta CCMP2712]|eukprot:XP_005822133.1 hypothetical protein GUITHDRAFT_118701 [Guillardia theta CCMP2712]